MYQGLISYGLDMRRFLRCLTNIRDSCLSHPPDAEQARPLFIIFPISALLLVFAFLTGGVNETGFVCYYPFPLIACFFLGSKKGAIATALIWVESELGKGATCCFTLLGQREL